MIKKVIVLITILCFWSANAQFEWTPAKVILKGGESFRGLVRFPKHFGNIITIGSSKFKYRKNRKSKVEKLGHETVEEVVFGDEDFTTVHFKYVPVSKNRFILMEEIINGKVSLYARTLLKTKTEFRWERHEEWLGTEDDRTIYYDDVDYYLMRPLEDTATKITNELTNSMFRRIMKKYFEDCEKIVGYLEDELYDGNELLQLVEDYNLLCE